MVNGSMQQSVFSNEILNRRLLILKIKGFIKPAVLVFIVLLMISKLDNLFRTNTSKLSRNSVILSPVSIKNVTVEVYYETKCPDSKRFLQNQIKKATEHFNGNNLKIVLIPYGKASVSN